MVVIVFNVPLGRTGSAKGSKKLKKVQSISGLVPGSIPTAKKWPSVYGITSLLAYKHHGEKVTTPSIYAHRWSKISTIQKFVFLQSAKLSSMYSLSAGGCQRAHLC